MYFEKAGHLGGVAEDDIQRISMTLPKFPVYFGDVILSIPAQMSGFGFQGTVHTFHGGGKICSKLWYLILMYVISKKFVSLSIEE